MAKHLSLIFLFGSRGFKKNAEVERGKEATNKTESSAKKT
jgi:hypothetical protein